LLIIRSSLKVCTLLLGNESPPPIRIRPLGEPWFRDSSRWANRESSGGIGPVFQGLERPPHRFLGLRFGCETGYLTGNFFSVSGRPTPRLRVRCESNYLSRVPVPTEESRSKTGRKRGTETGRREGTNPCPIAY
jgi:hypothetical protein